MAEYMRFVFVFGAGIAITSAFVGLMDAYVKLLIEYMH